METDKPTVLVAEDDRQIRDSLALRLSDAGFRVVTAADGDAALARLAEEQPVAAVLDVNMPGKDGFAVCEHLRATGSAIPVFFLTGAEEGAVRHHLDTLTKTVGGDHFLLKPYDGKVLAILLRDALARGTESTSVAV